MTVKKKLCGDLRTYVLHKCITGAVLGQIVSDFLIERQRRKLLGGSVACSLRKCLGF